MPTKVSESEPHTHCVLGSEVASYQSQICEILNHIKKPGDIRSFPKIAVISPTRFSRQMVVESLSREISVQVRRTDFHGQTPHEKQLKTLFTDNVVYICEECQYLYERRPHGFDILRSFLSQTVVNPRQIITTWNQYSWNFLSGFLHIERWFPIIITLPFLSSAEMKHYLFTTRPQPIQYLIDKELDNSLEIVRKEYRLSNSGVNLSVTIPYFSLQRRYSTKLSLMANKNIIPEEIFFGALNRLSEGDPGVASELWNRAKYEDEIRFSRLPEPAIVPNLSPLGVFILTLIFMYEHPDLHRLKQSITDEAGLKSTLYWLVSAGIISGNEDEWSVTAEGFGPALHYLMQRRMIW